MSTTYDSSRYEDNKKRAKEAREQSKVQLPPESEDLVDAALKMRREGQAELDVIFDLTPKNAETPQQSSSNVQMIPDEQYYPILERFGVEPPENDRPKH